MKLFLPFLIARAQETSLTSLSQVENSLNRFVGFLFDLFWVAAVGMLMWAAILFLTVGEDKERVTKAKRIILYAIIAAAIALLSNGLYFITYNVLRGE